MNLPVLLRRAFISNPRTVNVSPAEQSTLVRSGVEQAILQKYLSWRRGLMTFVVVATVLSAALATYRDYSETEPRVDLYETIEKHLPLQATLAIPAAMNAAEKAQEAAADAKDEDADGKASDESADASPADEEDEDSEPETAFSQFVDIVEIVSLYALAAAALAVVLLWTRFRLTFWIVVGTFGFTFLWPMVLYLCPWSWFGYEDATVKAGDKPVEFARQLVEGLQEASGCLISLLPTVLSLVPGVQRACVRVKLLLPQSILPGWFLVVASPFYALFLLVVFIAVDQVDSHPLFFGGMLLFILAPITYVVRSKVVTKALATPEDEQRLLNVKRIVGLLTGVAGLLLVIYLASREMLGIRLLGTDPKKALILPLDLVELGLETLSRSMFMTVLGADLFMRMNLRVWQSQRDFAASADAASYDRVMGEFERIV